MAKAKIPSAIERRHLIERDLGEAAALRYAEAYLEAGRDIDAIAFLVIANATERLEAMRSRALDSGDAFLLRAASDALGESLGQEQWQALERAAMAAGKGRYADTARRQADREEE